MLARADALSRRFVPRSVRRPIGIDSYAYHRLLGETRPAGTSVAALRARVARRRRRGAPARADFALLETCFLGAARDFDAAAYREAASGLPLGSPGARPRASASAAPRGALRPRGWAAAAGGLGLPVLRIVAGGPATRAAVEPLVPLLRRRASSRPRPG
jgi:hypothetical protein